MKTVSITLALSLTLVASAQAQPGPGPERGPMNVGAIIDARRALNLTPRQLMQLDSIERGQFAARSAMQARFRAKFDSLCGNREDCRLSETQAAALRDWRRSQVSEVDMLRRDSVAHARVMSILDTTQRRMLTERRPGRGRFDRMRGPRGRNGFGPRPGARLGGRQQLMRRQMMMRRFGQMEGRNGAMGMRRRPMGPPEPRFEDRRNRRPEIDDQPRRPAPRGRRPGDAGEVPPDSGQLLQRLP